MTTPPLGLRERRKLETRDQIRRTALTLVRAHGYDAVTVDLISAHAGVSVRTFFNYFANKESAMIALPPPLPEAAVNTFVSTRGPRGLFAELADLAVSMFAASGSVPSDFESSIQVVMGVPTLARMQRGAMREREVEFIALIATRLGLDPNDAEPAVIAAAFMGAVRVACERWSARTDERAFADEVRACLTVLSTAPDRGDH